MLIKDIREGVFFHINGNTSQNRGELLKREVLKMETVNQEEVTEEVKTFTQDDVNRIVEDRLKREREKYADYAVLKEKSEKLDAMEEASKTELQKAVERANALESELNDYKKANEVREIREKVAKETGIPANLLKGSTEEECKEEAQAIAEFAKPNAYPQVKDGGEVTNTTSKLTTKKQFEQWANEALGGI